MIPELGGVPETMLWTLHNRAKEAERPDGILRDPEAVRIYRSIDYDFERSFGKPDGSHAMRSAVFDGVVRAWLSSHPGGTVVELGCGLETQRHRCDDGRAQWVCIDLPEAIAVRDALLPAGDRCRHVATSALDPTWMDQVDDRHGVIVTAQGLLMYLEPSDVRWILTTIMERFPGVELVFDVIPAWFSRKTLNGFAKTAHYTSPPMPWGMRPSELTGWMHRLSPLVRSVEQVPFGSFRGTLGFLLSIMARVPRLRDLLPTVVHVRTATSAA